VLKISPIASGVVVCERTVDGHHEAVVHRHPHHLVHHVGFEVFAVLGCGLAGTDAVKQPGRLGVAELERCRCADAVVSRDCPMCQEITTPVLERGDVRGIARAAVARCRDEPLDVRLPLRMGDVQVLVRAEGGQDAAVERGVLGDRLVAGKVIEGIVSRGKDLDVEVLEQLAGPEAGFLQLGTDGVIGGIRRLCAGRWWRPNTLSN
jgi:hypothetical protein